MKNNLIILLIFLTACGSDSKPNSERKTKVAHQNLSSNMYDKIIHDFAIQSHYLVVIISSNGKAKFKAVIQNSDLYYVLNKGDSLTRDQYVSLLKEKFAKNQPLEVKNSIYEELLRHDIKKWNCDEVESELLDSKIVLHKYFNKNGVIKNEYVGKDIENCLINFLLKNSVFAYRDDESGYLVVDGK